MNPRQLYLEYILHGFGSKQLEIGWSYHSLTGIPSTYKQTSIPPWGKHGGFLFLKKRKMKEGSQKGKNERQPAQQRLKWSSASSSHYSFHADYGMEWQCDWQFMIVHVMSVLSMLSRMSFFFWLVFWEVQSETMLVKSCHMLSVLWFVVLRNKWSRNRRHCLCQGPCWAYAEAQAGPFKDPGWAFPVAQAEHLPWPRLSLCHGPGWAFAMAQAEPLPWPRLSLCHGPGWAFAMAQAETLPWERHSLCTWKGTCQLATMTESTWQK
jgi:hypothetical protein